MIESWMAVIFAVVIVVGMVAARIWTALLSEGLPLFRDWVRGEDGGTDRLDGADDALPSDPEVARRMKELEEQVQFLEALLDEPRGLSTPVVGRSANSDGDRSEVGNRRSRDPSRAGSPPRGRRAFPRLQGFPGQLRPPSSER